MTPLDCAAVSLKLAKALQKTNPSGYVGRQDALNFCDVLFPDSAMRNQKQFRHGTVSPGWLRALDIVSLGRRLDEVKNSEFKDVPLEPILTERILQMGRFPNAAWSMQLELLCLWRRTHQKSNSSCVLSYPPRLSALGTRSLLNAWSFSPSNASWVESLSLYNTAVENQVSRSDGPEMSVSDLKGMRHVVLTTLLQQRRWVNAVHFFQHGLRQKSYPGPVTTGLLVHRLGGERRWMEALRIYNLSIKMVSAQHRNLSIVADRSDLAKKWGTTMSIAILAVSSSRQELIIPMVRALSSSSISTPLAKLDGNFLAAVEKLQTMTERRDALRVASDANLLDYYKLVRGLVSKGLWQDALDTFSEGMRMAPPAMTRGEVERGRMHLLHAANSMNVMMVVEQLNRVCKRKDGVLLLSDPEVECVFSKSLSPRAIPGAWKNMTEPFWQYCLRVLSANYPGCVSTTQNKLGKVSRSDGSLATDRALPPSCLSFLLKNNEVPWMLALRIFCCSIEPHSNQEKMPAAHSTQMNSGKKSPSKNLLWQCMIDHLIKQDKHELVSQIQSLASARGVRTLLSAAFLMQCPLNIVRNSLKSSGNYSVVDSGTLFHILRQDALLFGQLTQHGEYKRVPFSALARSLQVVSLLIEKDCGISRVFHTQPGNNTVGIQRVASRSANSLCDRSWFQTRPSSVHCEVLKLIRVSVPNIEQRCFLSYEYCQLLFDGDKSYDSLMQRQKLYCATYEAILNLLPVCGSNLSPLVWRNYERIACDLLEECMVSRRCGIPPTHMLLPNQIDRLLPRLQRIDHQSKTLLSTTSDVLASQSAAQVKVSRKLVQYSVRFLTKHRGKFPPPEVDPALLHCLLKLCCRISEYETILQLGGSLKSEDGCQNMWECGRHLIETQSGWFGPQSVHSGSLALLYRLCASQGGTKWKDALFISSSLTSDKSPGLQCLSPRHHALFASLFGWECGLRWWHSKFPSEVLQQVAHIPEAVNYCLALTDLNDRDA